MRKSVTRALAAGIVGTCALILAPAASALDGPTSVVPRAQARGALLTPEEAAKAAHYPGTPYRSYDVAPACMRLPVGFMCGRSFDVDGAETSTPFPTLVTVEVLASSTAAEAEMLEIGKRTAEYGSRTTVVSSSPRLLVDVSRGFTAGGLANVKVVTAEVERPFGSTIISGSCAQRASVASQDALIACANRVERAQERALADSAAR